MKLVRTLGTAVVMLVAVFQGVALAADAPACAACAGCGGIMILLPIAFVALGIMYMVWVAKDAKSRGMENAVLWMLVAITWVGAIVYLLVRPKGNLVACPHCSNKRLETLEKCPHCGKA